VRQLRRAIIGQLSDLKRLGQIPFNIDRSIRGDVARLLGDPSTFEYRGGCGTSHPGQPAPGVVQRTQVGEFAGSGG
jgi:hypothetical protein